MVLAPSLGEWLNELKVHRSRICGVTRHSSRYDWGRGKPIVGVYSKINLEKIVKIKPDLILATKNGNAPRQIRNIEKLGYQVEIFDSQSIQMIHQSILKLGKLLGHQKQAKDWLQQWQQKVNQLKRLRSKSKKALIQVGHDPLIVSGKQTYYSDLFSEIQLNNIFEFKEIRYFRPRVSSIVGNQPDIIFVLIDENYSKEKIRHYWKKFDFLSDQVLIIQDDTVLKPTLGMLDSLRRHLTAIQKNKKVSL